jgi:hypothetical protein
MNSSIGMYAFLAGAMAMGSWVAGLFFLKFWERTRDRLFLAFALAFCVMGLERMVLGLSGGPNEAHISVYLMRLGAFVLLILAIVDKNRGRDDG